MPQASSSRRPRTTRPAVTINPPAPQPGPRIRTTGIVAAIVLAIILKKLILWELVIVAVAFGVSAYIAHRDRLYAAAEEDEAGEQPAPPAPAPERSPHKCQSSEPVTGRPSPGR